MEINSIGSFLLYIIAPVILGIIIFVIGTIAILLVLLALSDLIYIPEWIKKGVNYIGIVLTGILFAIGAWLIGTSILFPGMLK